MSIDSTHAANADHQAVLGILQFELARLRDATIEVWKNYLTLFTWFYGTQVLVLGWITTKKQDALDETNITTLAAATVVLNLLSLIATLRYRSFCAAQAERSNAICREIAKQTTAFGLEIEITSGVASDLIRFGFDVGAVAFSIAIIIWLYVFSRAMM